MKTIIDLRNKNILILGASSGIGREIAVLCSEAGAKVALVARREEKLKETVEKLFGDKHRYYKFDMNQLDGIDSLFSNIVREIGKIDGCVYSVGISGTRPLKMLKPSSLNDVMNINFGAFVETVRCISKKGRFNPGLSIVGISSISSTVGSLGKTSYCASKAAMDAAARCMAKELASNIIRVNTVCPGIVETDLFQTFKDNAGDSQDAKEKISRQYLGLGKPRDVANVVTFLISDAARMITGANVGIDGGFLSS